MEPRRPTTDPSRDFDALLRAMRASVERITPNRRRMTLDDAEDIVRLEFGRHGVAVSPLVVAHDARTFHRGLWWVWRHPVQAYREGWRWSLRGRD